jgi:hypothetical protein
LVRARQKQIRASMAPPASGALRVGGRVVTQARACCHAICWCSGGSPPALSIQTAYELHILSSADCLPTAHVQDGLFAKITALDVVEGGAIVAVDLDVSGIGTRISVPVAHVRAARPAARPSSASPEALAPPRERSVPHGLEHGASETGRRAFEGSLPLQFGVAPTPPRTSGITPEAQALSARLCSDEVLGPWLGDALSPKTVSVHAARGSTPGPSAAASIVEFVDLVFCAAASSTRELVQSSGPSFQSSGPSTPALLVCGSAGMGKANVLHLVSSAVARSLSLLLARARAHAFSLARSLARARSLSISVCIYTLYTKARRAFCTWCQAPSLRLPSRVRQCLVLARPLQPYVNNDFHR